jgi:hypothetical protein
MALTPRVVAIQIPVKTSTSPATRFGRIGSLISAQPTSAAAIGLFGEGSCEANGLRADVAGFSAGIR